MSTPDFSTAENNQELANEVSCLKAMLTLMLQAMVKGTLAARKSPSASCHGKPIISSNTIIKLPIRPFLFYPSNHQRL